MTSFDIAIIGAGPGGYVAAIHATQLGAKTALIERGRAGGVCLNRGCIPTKALIASARVADEVRRVSDFGIALSGEPSIDMKKVQERKDKIVTRLRDGLETLLKGSGVDLIHGTASFTGAKRIAIDGTPLDVKHILIATGSSWIQLPNIKIDGGFTITSDEALGWDSVPKRLLIVGGGVIGCEFACMMHAFGSIVTIVEATPSILPPVERAISRMLARAMKSGCGIEILTGTTIESTTIDGNTVKCKLSTGDERIADRVLVAVGRKPLVEGLNLDAAGVELTERGFIKVDETFRTSAEGVYAIGDVIGNPMLAHAASAEGIAAVEGIFSGPGSRVPGLELCPSPIFTTPEVASVGLTSEELTAKGIKFKTGRFPYAANGKALCDGDEDGVAIVHADENGKILGVHIIGKDATSLIAEATLAMKSGLTAYDIAATIHSHPTLAEIFAEACGKVCTMVR